MSHHTGSLLHGIGSIFNLTHGFLLSLGPLSAYLELTTTILYYFPFTNVIRTLTTFPLYLIKVLNLATHLKHMVGVVKHIDWVTGCTLSHVMFHV